MLITYLGDLAQRFLSINKIIEIQQKSVSQIANQLFSFYSDCLKPIRMYISIWEYKFCQFN